MGKTEIKFQNIEIYTVKPDNSSGHMTYPKDGHEAEKELNRSEVRQILDKAQFRGIYFVDTAGRQGYFISSHDGPRDKPADFSERIYLRPGDSGLGEYERVAERLNSVRPGQRLTVVIF